MIEPKGVDISPNADGGVLKELIKEGSGETPFNGDQVVVHYTGFLLDGTKFDSSRDRNEHFTFTLGKGQVIKGWDIGIKTMKKGEQAKFYIKSDYAYGDTGSGSIPPKATLLFDVELFESFGEDISPNQDKSITKRVITAGEELVNPNDGATVELHLKGVFDGKVFDERDVTFEIGEGAKHDIIEGIEDALLKINKGECASLEIKSKKAFGKNGSQKFNIPPNADVKYEVTLKSFQKKKESWEMDNTEKFAESELQKNKGGELFKQGLYSAALKKYKIITSLLENETFSINEEREKANPLLLAANLNIAMCYLKLNDYIETREACEKALKLDSKNEKGLFRLAQSYVGLAEFEKAVEYFSKVVEVNPSNKEAHNQIILTKQKIKEDKDREKKLYSKMFSATFSNGTKSEKSNGTSNGHEHNGSSCCQNETKCAETKCAETKCCDTKCGDNKCNDATCDDKKCGTQSCCEGEQACCK